MSVRGRADCLQTHRCIYCFFSRTLAGCGGQRRPRPGYSRSWHAQHGLVPNGTGPLGVGSTCWMRWRRALSRGVPQHRSASCWAIVFVMGYLWAS